MIVFIIGCARSGTSILGELIGAHQKMFYIGEQMQPVWHEDIETGHHYMTKDDVTVWDRARIKNCLNNYRDIHFNKHLVEKCPPNILRISFIRSIFPTAEFIHIVRDGRDVACSLVPGLTDSWQHLKPPGWQNAEMIYSGDPLKKGAWLWRNALCFGLQDLCKVNHLQIKYEDLVCDPVEIARQSLAYLGLTIDPNVMAFCSKIQNHTKGSYHALNQSHWFRDDHKVRIGRWKENIQKDKVAEIESICSPILEQLEYK